MVTHWVIFLKSMETDEIMLLSMVAIWNLNDKPLSIQTSILAGFYKAEIPEL